MLIDKSTWTPFRLADLTIKKEENDKTNALNRFDKFLKVEHLDAECLTIKRWGNIANEELPPTFYKIFRKGQMLYPTRNPHLKRGALASFDGICGEKTLTLEPIRELIDERFYPFIFLAHSFFNHTTKSIIGSTNPHVRWRDVAEYKFLLPSKDRQVKLAELLWAADEVVESNIKMLDQLITSRDRLIQNIRLENNSKATKYLKDILVLEYGYPLKECDRIKGLYPVVGSSGITDSHTSFKVNGPGIVVGRKGSAGVVTWVEKDFWPIDTAFWIKLKSSNFKLKFVYYLLLSLNLPSLAITTAVPGINREDVHLQRIKDFSKSEQEYFIYQMETIENSKKLVEDHIQKAKQIQKQLINQIF